MIVMVLGFFYQIVVFQRVMQIAPDVGFTTDPLLMKLSWNLHEHGVMGETVDASGVIVPDTLHVPLFPALTALVFHVFGPESRWALVMNNACFALAVVLTFFLGRRLHPWGGVFIALFLVVDPIFLHAVNAVMADAVFHVLIAWLLLHGIWMLQKGVTMARVMVAALLICLQELAHPVGKYLWVALCVTLVVHLWQRTRWRRVAAYVGVIMALHFATIGLWSLRNAMAGGSYSFVQVSGDASFWETLNMFPAHYLAFPSDFFSLFFTSGELEHFNDHLRQHAADARSWQEWMAFVRFLLDHGYWSIPLMEIFSKVVNAFMPVLALAGTLLTWRRIDRQDRDIGLFLALFIIFVTVASLPYATGHSRLPIVSAMALLAFHTLWLFFRGRKDGYASMVVPEPTSAAAGIAVAPPAIPATGSVVVAAVLAAESEVVALPVLAAESEVVAAPATLATERGSPHPVTLEPKTD
ncbi:MAG: glycosyltransferase family 39 protein [Magnetococcales bacterium]|nr:glycosyltransferase family 39 protein [Magnetococcales bacterium]